MYYQEKLYIKSIDLVRKLPCQLCQVDLNYIHVNTTKSDKKWMEKWIKNPKSTNAWENNKGF